LRKFIINESCFVDNALTANAISLALEEKRREKKRREEREKRSAF